MARANKIIILAVIILPLAIIAAAYSGIFFGKGNVGRDDFFKKAVVLDVVLENPKPNQEIASPLFIRGKARGTWYFEASFPAEILDNNGFLLGIVPVQALGDWMTENFVPFEATIPFSAPSTKNGVLVLIKDNPSGLSENDKEIKIPIVFREAPSAGETMLVNIFLNDSKYVNEPYFDCSRTARVERQVPKTQAIARAALEALLRGETEEERTMGFVSALPVGARLNKITIENGVARADFDEQLEFQVGGSCSVAAIRAQVVDTLKQFPSVKDVVISINGRTEDILQP